MTEVSKLNILVVGSGGREHALVQKCLESPLANRVMAAPGNGGMAAEVDCFEVSAEDIDGLVKLAQAQAVGLVIVGPETPLSLGLVDALQAAGILAYGPTKDGARLESSKAFCKDFLTRNGIPTAVSATFTETGRAIAYLETHPAPVVVKASGLAAGKGVIMAETHEEAVAAIKGMLEDDAFGSSGREILIEETLYGEEISIHIIVSGEDFVCLLPSQDHKRVGEGDTGLNTGGMGAYAPTSKVTPALQAEIEEQIIRPTLAGLKADGVDFRGVLYAGLMLTDCGAKVLEYNVRFGDPETQVLLPMLEDDLVPILLAAAKGESLPDQLRFKDGAAIVVVLAARGYPGNYATGNAIRLPEALPSGAAVAHAGTRRTEDGRIVTSGGRALGVSGRAASLKAAAEIAYSVCDQIDFKDKYLRLDIGHRELNRS